MSALLKNLFIILALVGTAALGYFLYKQNAAATLDTSGELASKLELESAQILRRLDELASVELDGEIFYDVRFSSLSTVAAPVIPEPVGSSDPFNVN